MILKAKQVHKTFQLGDHEIRALKGVDLEVRSGDFLAIAGSSGSGKTTLLNLLGALDTPTAGEIVFENVSLAKLRDPELADLRKLKIGFVFQTFNLLPVLTALENVEYALFSELSSSAERKNAGREALQKVGLEKFLQHKPAQLSGGQRQRVAIARALVKKPRLILADEPTANLDSKTASEILDLMQDLNQRDGVTFVFSSHDPLVLTRAKSVVKIADGLRVT